MARLQYHRAMAPTNVPYFSAAVAVQPDMRDAACRERPHLPWVTDDLAGSYVPPAMRGDLNEMRRTCASCVHLIECRDFALADASIYGVWGGLTLYERREIRAGRGTIRFNR